MLDGGFDKALHVSPFMAWTSATTGASPSPATTLSVHIESREGGERAFDATLGAAPPRAHARARWPRAARYPAATLRVLALIYAPRASRLKLKGVPVHPHPARRA